MRTPKDVPAVDPIDMPIRQFLAQVISRTGAESEWINIRCEEWPWRHIMASAERGTAEVCRVGRRLYMRRDELNRWLLTHRVVPRSKQEVVRDEPTKPVDPIDKMMMKAGFRPNTKR